MQDQTKRPRIAMIAILDRNGAIGKDNKLLFNIPEDMQHFRKLTLGKTVVMGYKTYQSIGHALPERRNIVLSTHVRLLHDAKICRNLEEVMKAVAEDEEVFIIGGESIYEQFIPLSDKLYLTIVDAEVPADKFFPDYSEFDKVEELGEGEKDDMHYKFLELTR